jgi:hypothetical protein
LYLRNAKGADFNPTTIKSLSNWLVNATTTNMAYMLSAQLAAMQLSVRHSFVDGNGLVYAPDLVAYGTVAGLNGVGFISINDLMTAAAAEIQLHGLTKDGSSDRPFQETLKTSLEDANNNRIFVQGSAGPFSFE